MTKTYYCEKCDYTCNQKCHYDQHCNSKKHIFGKKEKEYIICEACDYQTKDNSNWTKHTRTKKHIRKLAAFVKIPGVVSLQ